MSGSELTPDEEAFFKNGELPDALKAQMAVPDTAPAADPAVVDPAPTPAAADPAPTPAPTSFDNETQQLARRVEARLSQLQEQIVHRGQEPAPAPDPGPDPATDPLGALMHEVRSLKDSVSQMQQTSNLTQQQNAAQAQLAGFVSGMKEIRDEFAKNTPDFPDAYKHLRAQRIEDLKDIGCPEGQIPNALIQDEIQIALNAQQRGLNPAQVIYNMAKRYGYKPSAATAPTPAATTSEKISQAQKGSAAAIAPQRGATESHLSIEGLKDAGDADLDAFVMDEKKWTQLVGGRGPDIFRQ